LEMDSATYNVALIASGKEGRADKTMELMSEMERFKVEVRALTYNVAIYACQNSGDWKKAFDLLQQMQASTSELDTITCSSAIRACDAAGRWREALELLGSMPRRQVEANTVCYNTAINACRSGGAWAAGLQLVDDMATDGVERTPTTYSTVMSACSNANEWQQALSIFGEMAAAQVERNTIVFNMAISACEKGKQWTQVPSLLDDMLEDGADKSVITYSAAIAALKRSRKWQFALSVYDDFRSVHPTPDGIPLGSVLSSCVSASEWQVAGALLEEERLRWPALIAGGGSGVPMHELGMADLGNGQKQMIQCLLDRPGVLAVMKPSKVESERFIELVQRRSGTPVTCVSRLDWAVSGVLTIAIGGDGSASAEFVRAQFAGRLVLKTYHCLASGRLLGAAGTSGVHTASLKIEQRAEDLSRASVSEQGLESCTTSTSRAFYQFATAQGPDATIFSLVEARPITGRTHQIRVHLASMGCMPVSDPLYSRQNFPGDSRWCPRLFLHCSRIALRDFDGGTCVARAPLPRDLLAGLAYLRRIA